MQQIVEFIANNIVTSICLYTEAQKAMKERFQELLFDPTWSRASARVALRPLPAHSTLGPLLFIKVDINTIF